MVAANASPRGQRVAILASLYQNFHARRRLPVGWLRWERTFAVSDLALGVSTTRALAVVTTGEPVRREKCTLAPC